MALELASVSEDDHLTPRIIVIGVGGGGCNAVNNMIESDLQGVEFIAANTDAQSLKASLASRKLQLGSTTTGGLGSGAKPEMGRKAAQESAQDIRDALEGCNMVFIATGMGGGTGTGAAPVVAEIAQSMGILTVAVATKPFEFEGNKRMQAAITGLQELQNYVGTLIVIPNQNLFRIANENTTFAEAFKMADDVLCAGVRGVTDLIMIDGLVNLDFADIRTVMSQMGKAMMGTGEAEGENRAIRATESAVTNALLEDSSLRGAKEILVNITADRDLGLHEIDEAVNRVRTEAGEEAYVHFGAALDESMHGIIRVSVVATGIDADGQQHLALDSHTSKPSPASPASTASHEITGDNVNSGSNEATPAQEPMVAYGDKFAMGGDMQQDNPASAMGSDIIDPNPTKEEQVFIPPAAHRLAESATFVVHSGYAAQEVPQQTVFVGAPQATVPLTQDEKLQDEETESETVESAVTVQEEEPPVEEPPTEETVAEEIAEQQVTDANGGFARWQPSPEASPEPSPEASTEAASEVESSPEPSPEPSAEASPENDFEDDFDDGSENEMEEEAGEQENMEEEQREQASSDNSPDNSPDNSVVNLDERRAKDTTDKEAPDNNDEVDLLAQAGEEPYENEPEHETEDDRGNGNLWGIPAFLRR